MNREDIIRMAREADIDWHKHWDDEENRLERFAALVAAAAKAEERKNVAAWMIQRGYATGHGDTTEDLLKELDWQVLENWSSAMRTGAENEREACAQVCLDIYNDPKGNNGDDYYYTRPYLECAAAIRARSQS